MKDIIERVKKLLRLARDTAASPPEAAAALNRALALIQQHKIDTAALDINSETEEIIRDVIFVGERLDEVKYMAWGILQAHFRVRACKSHRCLTLVGFTADVKIAGYVFDFLVRACRRATAEWTEREKRHRRKTTGPKRKSYIRGWMYGVSSNLTAPVAGIDDGKTALILSAQSKQVDAAFEDFFPETREIKRQAHRPNRSAINQGYRDGSKVNIRSPLASPTRLSLE